MKNDDPLMRARWPLSVSRPVVTPLQPSVVYASHDPDALDDQYEGGLSGYTYAREGHPNAEVLAALIDRMEGAHGGVITGSGMAAVTLAVLAYVQTGEHVIGADQLYGRSLRLMKEELPRLGVETSLIDATNVDAVAAAIRPKTRMILVETVSNPTLRIADLVGIIALAKSRGILVAVDNTFTTPRGLKPLKLGADIVIHSVTKLLSGHSDATLGYVAAAEPDPRLSTLAATMGLTASPFDCWLAERGLYSFELRFDRAVSTAQKLAHALDGRVSRIVYPDRPDHPDHHRLHEIPLASPGNMVTFEIDGGRDAANRFVRAADRIAFAPTLGDIATTLSHPATSSHRALSEKERAAHGISEGVFRVSVGCEEPEALVSEIVQALSLV